MYQEFKLNASGVDNDEQERLKYIRIETCKLTLAVFHGDKDVVCCYAEYYATSLIIKE